MTTWMTVALALVLALSLPSPASAGAPTDQLRGSIDQVLKILSDPELKKESKIVERRGMIRNVANDIFDFTEISQRSLGRFWSVRTPAEGEEFVRLFGDLLEQAYISKIEGYAGERILYAGESMDGDQAVVKTRIVTKQGTEIPVDYRMSLKADRWRAYDVNIEGISLVANYRGQFNSIITRSGYPELVTKLKAKQDERPAPRDTGRRREEAAAPAAGAPGGLPRQSP